MTDDAAQSPVELRRPSNWVGAAILVLWLGLGAALAIAAHPGHILTFAFVMVGWLLSVMAHEFSHAYVGWLGGDHTVRAKGYLDFDPRRYGNLQTALVIPLLALALGGIGFPGGVVYLRMDLIRSRLWKTAAALAGPAATAILLLGLALVLRLWTGVGGGVDALLDALSMLAFLQATALVLNLLPIPGLDGFNAIRPYIPESLGPAIAYMGRLSTLALLALIFFVPGGGEALFRLAAELCLSLGISATALDQGWSAFHFWR